MFIKKVANDCKTAANKLLTPNTKPCLSLLTNLAISELYYKNINVFNTYFQYQL